MLLFAGAAICLYMFRLCFAAGFCYTIECTYVVLNEIVLLLLFKLFISFHTCNGVATFIASNNTLMPNVIMLTRIRGNEPDILDFL